jgi:hypothetical protein
MTKKTNFPWILLRQVDADTSSAACWGSPVGAIVFRSKNAATKYAVHLAEKSGIEGPWRPERMRLSAVIKFWGDGRRYWRYRGPGSYELVQPYGSTDAETAQ